MYHSITIGQLHTESGITSVVGKNTWEDWHLIPSSRPFVAIPELNANTVEIPFRDGAIDLAEAVTGYTTYKDRSGTWEFYIVNDYEYWVTIKKKITNYLHGLKMCVWLEDDPEYYYEGRLTVSDYKPGANNSTITISYVLKPYKLSLASSEDEWLWDPFNFEEGYITEANEVTSPCEIRIRGGRMRSYPTITTNSNGISVSLNGGNAVALQNGENVMTNMILPEGENVFVFTGNGKVSIHYREGSL